MILAEYLFIITLSLGTLAALNIYWLLTAAFLPRLVDRAERAYEKPVKTSLLGLMVTAAAALLAGLLVAVNEPVTTAIAVCLTALFVLAAFIGSTGLSRKVGARLPSPVDEAQPWRQVLRGGIVLSLSFLFPIVGWLGLALTLISGLGAFCSAVFKRRVKVVQVTPSAGELPLSQNTGTAI